jgi:hypothetical protein
MTDEPQYKMVDGELVQLTPEEIADAAETASQAVRTQTVASTTLDMGKTMFQILTE